MTGVLTRMHSSAERAPTDATRRMVRLERLARLLDTSITIPGTSFRIGLDPLVGLVPVVGDSLTALVSAWFVVEGRRLGARRRTQLRMTWNTLLDATVGMVPILGDAFDAWFRANERNVRLLRADLARQGVADPTKT